MFGYVTANHRELDKQQKDRYAGVYCGICRQIRIRSSQLARITLSYDTVFLALLLMSLYEPEESRGKNSCLLHPVKRRSWIDNEFIRYAADMNVALAYFNALDDWNDDGKHSARMLASSLESHCERIRQEYPRQYAAIENSLAKLSSLEKEQCSNPDEPAAVFGELMAQLLVYREDIWAPTLEKMGTCLGRFIYLMDASQDYDRDQKRNKYNPFLAMGQGKQPDKWREYLVLTMGRCCDAYERLPLVQDKALLDNILYSGVWVRPGIGQKEGKNQ